MRVGTIFLVCGIVTAVVFAHTNPTEAQLRRRSSVLQSRTRQMSLAAKQAVTQASQVQKVVVNSVFALSQTLSPANGPEDARGIAYMYYDDEDMTLNSGHIVVSGLPEGQYLVWLVFGDIQTGLNVFSVPVATFTPARNGERTEAHLTFSFVEGIDVNEARQLVVTSLIPDLPQIGTEPVTGAAGYPDGPAAGTAVLAAHITGNGNPENNPDDTGEQDTVRRQRIRQTSRSPLLRNRRR